MTKLTKMWAQLVKEQEKKQVVTIEKKAEIIKAVATMPKPETKRQRHNNATELLLRRSRGSEWATIYRIKYGRK